MVLSLLRFFLLATLFLTSCVSHLPPPRDVNNICNIFKQYPNWYQSAKIVQARWKIPIAVQMAIIHQESKFNSHARPPRTKLFKIIPFKRPSSAYGYTQALHSTWKLYRKSRGYFSSRSNFADGLDFIGWYANEAYHRAGIQPSDAYSLYLAYHEGIGGYQHQSHLKKTWLLVTAKKVKAMAALYSMQLNHCKSC